MSAVKIFTFKDREIERAEEELRRWNEEKTSWCSIFHKITRKMDGVMCIGFDPCGSGIMSGNCGACCHWENPKQE